LEGTDHPYKVTKLLWPAQVERKIESLLVGRSLHICCGLSLLGDVRLDLNPDVSPDFVHDASNMKDLFEDDSFDTVFADPPYNGKFQWNHDLLSELSRIASKRIIFQHWVIPVNARGRYKKAQEKFALGQLYNWMPKSYFGRVQVISVFDRI
jgi:hypothetical protein